MARIQFLQSVESDRTIYLWNTHNQNSRRSCYAFFGSCITQYNKWNGHEGQRSHQTLWRVWEYRHVGVVTLQTIFPVVFFMTLPVRAESSNGQWAKFTPETSKKNKSFCREVNQQIATSLFRDDTRSSTSEYTVRKLLWRRRAQYISGAWRLIGNRKGIQHSCVISQAPSIVKTSTTKGGRSEEPSDTLWRVHESLQAR